MDESAIRAQIKAIDTILAELKEQLERGYIELGRDCLRSRGARMFSRAGRITWSGPGSRLGR
jgi:hypothetical protein